MGAELTVREEEVSRLVAQGLTNDEIAARLAISRRTVETHLRAVFRKTGATRRAQLVARSLHRDDRPVEPAAFVDRPVAPRRPDARPPDVDRRLRLYADAIRGLIDRQFPLFEERVEITLAVGERDGLDTVVERRRTTPKPYLIYRILRPITAVSGSPIDPDDLALECDVHGHDIGASLNPMQGADGHPLLLMLFQPGLQAVTEWTLRYRSPALWDPLRSTGEDTLRWATASLDGRHRPTINELVLHVVFPPAWTGGTVTEERGSGRTETARLPTGHTQVTWHARTPVASEYHWVLRART